jgi:hypothetical protein
LRDACRYLFIVREWLTVAAHDGKVRCAAKYFVPQFVTETVCQSQRHNQRRDSHCDTDYSDDRSDAREPPLLSRTQMTKG